MSADRDRPAPTRPAARDEDPLASALSRVCAGRVEAGAPLAALTTLRVGGPARVLVTAERDEDLAAVGRLAAAHAVPWLVVGRGSNLLIADTGWDGVALTLGRAYRGHRVLGATEGGATEGGTLDAEATVVAGAAEPMPALAARLADRGLAGFAWAAAVPGSIGGAVRMNAGAHGTELRELLVAVEVVRLTTGERQRLAASELHMRYRHTELPPDAVVVSATLALRPGNPQRERERIAEVMAWRRAHQPVNRPSCGSVFTNPPGDSAGRLIEASGAKGLRMGGARISEQHANFIVTEPGARASDVHALVTRVAELVEQRHGLRLRPEVVMVGDFPGAAASPAPRAHTGR